MLQYCGYSYAMDNASENVKNAAKHVCPSNEMCIRGREWYTAFAGFLVGDVVLCILAVVVSCKYETKGIGVLSRVGEKFSTIVGCVMLACIGPVSYTHLDVYKRQSLYGCPNPFCRPAQGR